MAKLSDFGYSVMEKDETVRHEALLRIINTGIGEGLYKTLIYRMKDARKAPKPAFNAATKYTIWEARFKKDAAFVKKQLQH